MVQVTTAISKLALALVDPSRRPACIHAFAFLPEHFAVLSAVSWLIKAPPIFRSRPPKPRNMRDWSEIFIASSLNASITEK